MSLTEALRLHNPATHLGRMCIEDITLDLPKDKKVPFTKGDVVYIPLNSFAKDPEYFEEPLRFNPDRFAKGDSPSRLMDQGIFFPFGMGPRSCIGNRFALAQGKYCIAAIVRKFEISVNPKTKDNQEINPLSLLATLTDCYLNFKEL